jgi:acyl-CoA hydrolase
MIELPEYRQKTTSAARAVEAVRSGDRVYLHLGCAAPDTLTAALLERADQLRNVEIIHPVPFGNSDYARPEYAGHFRHNGLFLAGENTRRAVAEGRADYTPASLSEWESLFTSRELPLDVAFIQTSPPDAQGFLNMGVGVDSSWTAATLARHTVVEVNDRMPRTRGNCSLHVSQISAIVESSRPLYELPPVPSNAVQRQIAANVASLIPDGATLQMGIGAIPDAVLACLGDRHDLGIHSEMCSDGVIPLIEAGVITGARKTLHPGKVVVGFVLGTKRLFNLVHENPMFEFCPSAYTNDPFIIGRNDNMIAINSAVQVDLTGQVSSDSIGGQPYSGFGGQLDFIRGAGRSRGGKPIIALPSTARGSAVSRIVPALDAGAGVVDTRADVRYVVTEHGVAYLRGKTLRQRAEALISIADPKFHDELWDYAARVFHVEPRGALAVEETR